MTFFNKKEEVIEIQLTQYGKYLVSLGKFKPTEYAFFDADVIYDREYTDLSEAQNDSELRIKNAIRPKTQYVFSPGPETEITKANKHILDNKQELARQLQESGGPEFDDTEVEVGMSPVLTEEDMLRLQVGMIQPAALKDYVLSHPLGTSEYGSSYVPAWSVKFLNSELTGSKPTLSGSNGISRIPQLFLTSSYETFITFVDEDGTYLKDNVEDELDLGVFADMPYGEAGAGDAYHMTVYQDDSTFQVKPHYLLVEAEEKNSLFEKENFDVEVYKVDGNEMQLLYFHEPGVDPGPPTSKFVDYYFEVLTDYEIDNDLFCASSNVQKKKHIFSDQDRVFDCFESKAAEFNIYDIEIDEEEPC